jgi:uncharacterized protein YabE (DUF348 family)
VQSDTVSIEPPLHTPTRAIPAAVWTGLLTLICLAIAGSFMVLGYRWTGRSVSLIVDGRTSRFRTHYATVEGLLEARGVALRPEDIVRPGLETPLDQAPSIVVEHARSVTLLVDGIRTTRYTHAASPAAVLLDAGVEFDPHDRIAVNGQTSVPELPFSIDPSNHQPVEVRVDRAVPFVVADGVRAQLWTTGGTVGEALAENGIRVYLADAVTPPLTTPMSAGLTVNIVRSRPVRLLVDGDEIRTRTRASAVADVLAQENIVLRKLDYTVPDLGATIHDGETIDVRRVDEEFAYEEEPIPFETVWQPDAALEIDSQRIAQAGATGTRRRRIRIVYENGEEVDREITSWWVEEEPTPEIIGYGTQLVWRTVDTPQGPKRYWRKLRVLATSYSAATSGKSRDHPGYGLTRLGWEARRGVVAVDPTVIRLRQNLYIPGYGLAVAGDTGGRVKGRHIDLGFDDGELELWYRWIDIYQLEPAPPANRIPYVLPDWPPQR